MHRRLTAVLTVIAAVIVFAAAVYVIVKKDPVPQAGSSPTFSASLGSSLTASPTGSSESATNSGSPTGAGSATSSTGTRKAVVAFLGDDYTLGIGASATSKGFVPQLIAALGVTGRGFGGDGAGYAKSNSANKSYTDFVDALVATHPAVVIVSGGRNDTSDFLATLQTTAAALFSELHQKLPGAKLIAVAPFWGDSDAPSAITDIGNAVKAGVQGAGGTYLDIPDPLHGHSNWMGSAADPNDAGYAAIVSALAPKLRPLLPVG